MIISKTKKFIYFSLAKTASTSTGRFFEQFCDPKIDHIKNDAKYPTGNVKRLQYWKHMPPRVINKNVTDLQWNSYFKFGNIRNPWDRVVSGFFFSEQFCRNPKLQSFDNWVNCHLKKHCDPLEEWYNVNGLSFYDCMDFFIRFENLKGDIETACAKLGLPCDLSKLGNDFETKRDKDYRKYYNDDTKLIVAKKFKKEIEVFNYEF